MRIHDTDFVCQKEQRRTAIPHLCPQRASLMITISYDMNHYVEIFVVLRDPVVSEKLHTNLARSDMNTCVQQKSTAKVTPDQKHYKFLSLFRMWEMESLRNVTVSRDN